MVSLALCLCLGSVTEFLKNFLEQNLPEIKKSSKKAPKFIVGVQDAKIGGTMQESLGLPCESSSRVNELFRGIRAHFSHYVKALKQSGKRTSITTIVTHTHTSWHIYWWCFCCTDLLRAQLGLSHSYSRAKVKFNVNRVDNMIIQSIAMLDQLDKDLNTFSMRVREWYGWHFPELVRITTDNYTYARLATFIKNRNTLSEASLEGLKEITLDEEVAKSILEAAKASMGTDISEIDMAHVERFASQVVSLSDYRKSLFNYLSKKMSDCAPNLTALIGELVGARLISHAGSLTNLAKYPASTVQILGAEKALFRALKTKGNTPKYGLIYHSSFIGKAAPKNKGRISRYLANKCSMASRIDSFSDEPTDTYGKLLKTQVEERLNFYETGVAPRKNIDVMAEASKLVEAEHGDEDVEMEAATAPEEIVLEEKKKSKKSKKRALGGDGEEEEVKAKKAKKSSKKEKKDKKKSVKKDKKKSVKKDKKKSVKKSKVAAA